MKMQSIPKYKEIVANLQRQIMSGALREGQELPTYRALMAEHDVTVTVVRQAMQVLQANGVVESVPRIGCRVAPVPVRRRLIGLVLLGFSESPHYLEQIKLLHDELERVRCDLAIKFVAKTDESTLDACGDWTRRLDGVLLAGRVPMWAAQRMVNIGVPLVQIGELTDAPFPAGLSAVTIDLPSLVRLAVSHLVSSGHRRIAFDSGYGSRYYDLLREAFDRCRAEFGIDGLWIFPAAGGSRASGEQIVQQLAEREDPPTAILSEEGGYASRLVELLQANGWPVPERISVLAITASTQSALVRRDLSSILTSTRELILRAVEILNDQLGNSISTVRVERLVARYVPGNTCRVMATPTLGSQTVLISEKTTTNPKG